MADEEQPLLHAEGAHDVEVGDLVAIRHERRLHEGVSRRLQAGTLAQTRPIREAAALSGLSENVVRYWKKKVEDDTFHTATHGGARNWKYPVFVHCLVEAALYEVHQQHPLETIDGYVEKLRGFGLRDVTSSWVVRTLSRWNWSGQNVYHVQANKYSWLNWARYVDHVYAVPQFDPSKVLLLLTTIY